MVVGNSRTDQNGFHAGSASRNSTPSAPNWLSTSTAKPKGLDRRNPYSPRAFMSASLASV